jgi:hypothetical protein
LEFSEPPASRQHFDIWNFQKADGESSYFGRMPPQVVENLLWFYTEPGQIIFDGAPGRAVGARYLSHEAIHGTMATERENHAQPARSVYRRLPSLTAPNESARNNM